MSETSTETDYEIRFAIDPATAAAMDTRELRESFLIEDLFGPDMVGWTYTHYERLAVGSAVPVKEALRLEAIKPTGTVNFLDRRELIAVNIGGKGTITADGELFSLEHRDMAYLGMGTKDVVFASENGSAPAKFYLLSAPAHQTYKSMLISVSDAKRLDLGAPETCNERSIFQFIHPDGARTCQLVVGMTTFAAGSVWNTMPCHVHDRRAEAYLYFDLDEKARVVHLMGEPDETRHLIVANEEAILSPAWSIHSGVGTARYTFVWAMAGDNVDYTDVDPVAIEDLR
ncbi:5-dehydro-4-deoxy-D-glucuronate isomerase [Arsenicitalea aurantiaca]|uniref:4-deoxy-L-threo-5-hexosulose-uronate ketol-isomerase n=2 Tax=Arsenicitalea aurantiaca TaxID=1783274 RepID=A0A433X7J2_9HYPH|nr:5-dehydro-4-deoxy-D-glucuronate isomerase [Arsenicitalea aurantiaca]